jgi:hypothetical protein
MLNIAQRDSGVSSWWNAANNRLRLTKGPLATAQQVIQAKEREKHEKERKHSADWP